VERVHCVHVREAGRLNVDGFDDDDCGSIVDIKKFRLIVNK
jgi:hypothetical protein